MREAARLLTLGPFEAHIWGKAFVVKVPALALIAVVGLLALFAAACGDDDDNKTPTAAATTAASPSAAASTAANSTATATKPAAATATSSPAADGTIDPLGAGQQTPWTVKSNPDPINGVVTVNALRTGFHPELGGWERIVFEFQGTQRPGATVQYVTKATSCGSGQAVQVPGDTILEVAITNAQAHDNAGKSTLPPTIAGASGTNFQGGASSCDFEGHVTWDFGLTGKHNFKVTTLENPVRIVIDIKQ
jgi:hypothetical protein